MNTAHPLPRPLRWSSLTGTLLLATLFDLMPWPPNPMIPDLLALMLACWALAYPRQGMLFTAFALGLLMDAQHTTELGSHALLYTLIVFLIIRFQHRLRWFGVVGQMPHLLAIFLVSQATLFVAQFLIGLPMGGPEQFMGWISTTLLWPLTHLLRRGHAAPAVVGTSHSTLPRRAPHLDPLHAPRPHRFDEPN
ncbi:MAG: rod shape-determining protein MreD [Lautropia sp.]|nr:rod shape-determining protein MreD [Lautropia sp.]